MFNRPGHSLSDFFPIQSHKEFHISMKTFPSTFENILFPSLHIFFSSPVGHQHANWRQLNVFYFFCQVLVTVIISETGILSLSPKSLTHLKNVILLAVFYYVIHNIEAGYTL